ncbi:MAG: hypothetical protein FD133_1671 [Erysipelotrichaceae bacterium]|nr:MAG: hypothetical protein FD133_1671 [Erysipelotrichaceae bacterium]
MLLGSSKKINITPPIGLRMSGFDERNHGADGILNQLFANVLVLGDGLTKVAIVTLDLSGVDKVLTKAVRDAVSQKTDIPHHAIMLIASHTHSGPEAWHTGDMGKISRPVDMTPDEIAYRNVLPGLIANGIVWRSLERRTFSAIKTVYLSSNHPQLYQLPLFRRFHLLLSRGC